MNIIIRECNVVEGTKKPDGCNGMYNVLMYENGKHLNKGIESSAWINERFPDMIYKVGKQFVYVANGTPQKVFRHFGEVLDHFSFVYKTDAVCEFLKPIKCTVI